MKELSFFKKLKLFRDYWILLKRSKEELTDKTNGLNLRVDRVGRIYTVYNAPEDVRSYGKDVAEKYIKEYIGKVENKFINLGMVEYVGIRDMERVGELDYLIVFGFKGFDTSKFFTQIITYLILFSIGLLITYFSIT